MGTSRLILKGDRLYDLEEQISLNITNVPYTHAHCCCFILQLHFKYIILHNLLVLAANILNNNRSSLQMSSDEAFTGSFLSS